MAFSSTITSYGKSGDKIVTKGTFTASGSETGGDINTGLTICASITLHQVEQVLLLINAL